MSPSHRVHDPELLDALEAIEPEKLSREVWRVAWASRDPLIGNNSGGRWHPQNSFECLYSSLEADGALAEAYYHLSRAPIFSSSQVKLCRLSVETQKTLRLEKEVLANLRIEEAQNKSMDHDRSQEIGAAARMLEFDSLLVPSVRFQCLNLVMFLDRLNIDKLRVIESSDINWPAWKKTHSQSTISTT